VQHARAERPFALRFALVKRFAWLDRVASVVLLLAPIVFVVLKAPILLALQVVAGLLLLAIRVVVHLVTLPVEFDASFSKALPVLERGYLPEADLPAARRVLKAAAWTYVAAALATLLDVARWVRMLRF
jgi:Zn-dependent membrane protease YugP